MCNNKSCRVFNKSINTKMKKVKKYNFSAHPVFCAHSLATCCGRCVTGWLGAVAEALTWSSCCLPLAPDPHSGPAPVVMGTPAPQRCAPLARVIKHLSGKNMLSGKPATPSTCTSRLAYNTHTMDSHVVSRIIPCVHSTPHSFSS